jgi:hypothetical protein
MPTKQQTGEPPAASMTAAAGASTTVGEPPRELTGAEQALVGGTATVVGSSPTLSPPGTAGALSTAGDASTTWQANTRVGALYTTNNARNAWAYVTNIGWKRLASNQDAAVTAMADLTRLSKDANLRMDYREEADGIHEIYIW